ncbi:MAG: MFS transporter [Rhodospirillaceae bacterium]|jgi:MFS family permease|nr:MFS transporter [Rhodospirillaceae bacterium]MBT3885258.1 MFS transporter [Rhodospirillaceae bacterium]MBT4115696.1 MFS transporter [Rhodospirillaceae bacterium]MBT4673409.1 MFS transporter [Rhodospirillaceae bacterium]MBT4721812.1 MFS transporter [Rhodospirillaceae bacterium]
MSRRGYIILISASMVLLLSMGMRQSFGLFQSSISQSFGIGISVFSLSLAIQNLAWGLAQPIVGAIADKFGSGRVIAVAGLFQFLGLLMLANASTIWELHVSAGIIIGVAGAGTTWAVILTVIARNVPPERRTFFLGLGGAIGTGGQVFMVPLNQYAINNFGWATALIIIAAMIGLIVPLAYVLRGNSAPDEAGRESTESLLATLDRARRHSGYLYLTAGFFVCGFQIMFIIAHLPNYLNTLGMPDWLPGTAISIIGVTNLAGTLIFGWLGDRFSKKYLLSILYLMRSLAFVIFLLAPISPASVMAFAFVLGFLWLPTIPLTNALVGQLFGLRYLATLAGVVFASHQLGSFIAVFAGGILFDATGSYTLIWQIAIGLGFVAALLHLPINENPVEISATQPAQ